jgi:hypothetical protein
MTMRNEISEIKRAVSVICANEMRARRSWSTGERSSRTDGGTAPALTTAMVDAVFEEESVSFVDAAPETAATVSADSKSMVASLAAQLAVLEDQCVNLRRLLNEAGLGASAAP